MGSTRSRAGIWAEAPRAARKQQVVKNSDFLIRGFSGKTIGRELKKWPVNAFQI
jgi:hypothetical protein